MLSLKGNLQLLCLKKPHPLFMFKRNGSSYWETVCLARKKCLCGRCFTFEWRQRAKMWSCIGSNDHRLMELEKFSWKPLGKGEDFPSLARQVGYLEKAKLFLGGKNAGQAMCRAGVPCAIALAEGTSGLHICASVHTCPPVALCYFCLHALDGIANLATGTVAPSGLQRGASAGLPTVICDFSLLKVSVPGTAAWSCWWSFVIFHFWRSLCQRLQDGAAHDNLWFFTPEGLCAWAAQVLVLLPQQGWLKPTLSPPCARPE